MTNNEKIVLMTGKCNSTAIPSALRLERVPRNSIDKNAILYVAQGPYKGITITKMCKDIRSKQKKPDVTKEFNCFIMNSNNLKSQIKENRKLSFWFKDQVFAPENFKIADQFFAELVEPEKFPKDKVAFIKKSVILLQSYVMIHCLDMTFERSDVTVQDAVVEEAYRVCLAPNLLESFESNAEQDESNEQEVIRNFVTVHTPDKYDYQFVPEVAVSNKTFLTFQIKAAANAHICLSAIYGNLGQKTIEITIGGKDNSRSWISENAEGAKRAEAITHDILSDKEFTDIWMSWKDGVIEVGKGRLLGKERFMYCRIPQTKRFNANCLAVSTDVTGNGEWEFIDLIYPGKSKAERRAKVRASLLWLAKKQRMVNVLEDAYPDSMPTGELLRLSKIRFCDMMVAVVMLRELQKKELIKEVSKGDWMRMPGGLIGGKSSVKHEIRMVTNMPVLTGREQPTIAIITAMYCEKQAVDVMITNKVTYVRYVKQGDSSVYTLGKIGKFQVVSTKLPRVGRTAAANISANNAITRLLGTFNKVDHVIIVGVAGGVPNFADFFRHNRLGDVVVSVSESDSDHLYVFGEKMEFDDVGQVSFSTKAWSSKYQTLQNAARQLKNEETDSNSCPWERYIEEGKELLHGDESNFYRPASKTDKILRISDSGDFMQYEHPEPPLGFMRKENLPVIRFGSVGSGKFISRNDVLRDQFADMCNVISFDYEFDSVLESLEGNRCESFILVRGIADYSDGLKMKEWQPYASLAAAAYMKSLVLKISD